MEGLSVVCYNEIMSTSKEFKDYVLGQLSSLENVTCRPMMGEFLLYQDGTLFGGIYDEKLLLKEVDGVRKYNLPQAIPYSSAKRTMFHVEDLDDTEHLRELVLATVVELKK